MATTYCIRCGQSLPANSRFCIRCGTPVAGAPIPGVAPAVAARVGGGTGAPGSPTPRRSFFRSPFGIILLVAIALAVLLVALATIPIDHSQHYSASVSGSGGSANPTNVWIWSFPSGVNVTVHWSGPAGATTDLVVTGGLGTFVNESGTSGTFSFTASPIPYMFQASVYGSGSFHGTVDVTASYRAPIL